MNSRQLKEKLVTLKWKNGFTCAKCQHKSYIHVSKNEVFSARKCKNCNYVESPVANTIFGNIKFDLMKAVYIYNKIENNPNIKLIELEREFQVRRQTIAKFKKKIIENDFKLLYGNFETESATESCLTLIKKIQENVQTTYHFQLFLSNNYFNDDEDIISLFNTIINENYQINENGKIQISDKQKWELYSEITGEESLAYKNFLEDGMQKLECKFSTLEALIEDFLIVEEIKNLREKSQKKSPKKELTSADTKLKKLRYTVFLEQGYFSLLEKAFNEDTIQLQQQENKKYTDFHFFDLKHYIELTKIKMLKAQQKIITNQVSYRNLALNFNIATQIRQNRIALEYCRNSFDRVNNEGYEYLKHGVAIQKKQEKFFGKVKLKNEVGPLIQFVGIISTLLDTPIDAKNTINQLGKLFPIMDDNFKRLSKARRKEALEIVVDYCKMFLVKAVITYEDIHKLLNAIIKNDKVLGIDSSINKDNLKYFILIYCRVGEFDKARKMLNNNITHIKSQFSNDVSTFNNEVIRYYEDESHTYKKYIVDSPFNPEPLGLSYIIGWYMLRVKGRYFTDKEFEKESVDYFEEYKSYIEDKKEDEIKRPDRLACLNFIEIFIQLYYIKFGEKIGYSLVWDKETKRTIRNDSNLKVQELDKLITVLKDQEYNIDKFWLEDEITKLKK